MAILLSSEIFDAICNELDSAEESVQIMTAYGKTNAISAIIEKVKPTIINKRIMFRFRLDDITKKSTDFNVIEICRDQGWKVYIRFDLHAKTYVVDNKRGIIGSANATNSGLAIGRTANYEMAALVDIEDKDVDKINNLFKDALEVDNELWAKLDTEYSKIKCQDANAVFHQWSKEITDQFNPHIETLFSYELPEKGNYTPGDQIQFLDMVYSGNDQDLRDGFRWSTPYLWLRDQVIQNNGELYFGELSTRLHNSLVTDPKPYRKDVKMLLSNLLQLITNLEMPEIGVDRPNHSQRVFLR